jgi:hypothetical protein
MNTIYLCISLLIRRKYTFFTVCCYYFLLFTDFFVYLFGGLECVGPSLAYVTHFVFLRDVWIQTQKAAAASRRTSNLATHLPLFPLIFVPTLQRQNTEISKQIFPEKEHRDLSPNFHIHASGSALYIPTIGLPILLEEICIDRSWDYINCSQAHECGNWG